MDNNIIISNSFYRNRNLDTRFINSVYAMNIAIEYYFSNLFFNNDLTRIIFSSNEYAFRRRASQSDKSETPVFNNIYLPFLNYYLTGTSNPTTRPWFNWQNVVEGIFIDELGYNIKINPVKFQYETTVWYSTDYDMQYSLIPLYNDHNTETKISYNVQVDNQLLSCIGILSYNITYNPTYKENDWLNLNKIRSISLDINMDTFLLEGFKDVSIPNQVIFDFLATKKEMNDVTANDYETLANRLITYYT